METSPLFGVLLPKPSSVLGPDLCKGAPRKGLRYLEGQGDPVSELITRRTGVLHGLQGLLSILTQPP